MAVVLSLLVPCLSFFRCLGKALLRDWLWQFFLYIHEFFLLSKYCGCTMGNVLKRASERSVITNQVSSLWHVQGALVIVEKSIES